MQNLPEIQLTVKNAEEEIMKLLRVVKPTWTEEQIELKKFSGGFSCLMYSGFSKEDPGDGVVVRARTNMFKDFPHVKESAFEIKVVKTMHEQGLFPDILATFQNGFCYKYITGTPLIVNAQRMHVTFDDAIVRLMARKLAEIHSIKIEGCDYSTTNYFRNLFSILEEKYPENSEPIGREEVLRELKIVEEYALQTGSPLVLCHGDPHPGNMVHNQEKDTLTYVDWELAHVGYQASDIAYALQVYKFLGINPLVTFDFPEDMDKKYFRYYLEKWFEVEGKSREVTDEDVEKLENQVNVFRLSCQLFWIIIMVSQFTVGMPDHVDMTELMDNFKKTQESLEEKALEDGTTEEKATNTLQDKDLDASHQELTKKFIGIMYADYLKLKEEILPNDTKKPA